MNMKKFVVSVFIGINIMTIWCSQSEPAVTACIQIPQSLVSKQSFDCVLASDFDQKVQCVKDGYVMLGSVRNPLFEHTGKRDKSLLTNQKYGFIFYKVSTGQQQQLSQEGKQELLVDIPEEHLIQSVQNKRILIDI